MKRLLLLIGVFTLVSSFALAAGYDKTEQTGAYTLRLRVPQAALAIAPLKTEIFARWKKNSDEMKKEAVEDKGQNPGFFHGYALDTNWRVTFESGEVISLSADSFIDEGGAHPNGAFDSIVWDKRANRDVPFEELFLAGQRQAAFAAIAAAARKAWIATITRRAGSPPDPEMANDGIGADPKKLGHYALTYAKGETRANGIVLLYGAGEVWPHVVGDFRLSVPVTVFRKYLTPRWRAAFA